MEKYCPILFTTVMLSCVMKGIEPDESERPKVAQEYTDLSRCVQQECAWWNPETKLCAVHQQKGA